MLIQGPSTTSARNFMDFNTICIQLFRPPLNLILFIIVFTSFFPKQAMSCRQRDTIMRSFRELKLADKLQLHWLCMASCLLNPVKKKTSLHRQQVYSARPLEMASRIHIIIDSVRLQLPGNRTVNLVIEIPEDR